MSSAEPPDTPPAPRLSAARAPLFPPGSAEAALQTRISRFILAARQSRQPFGVLVVGVQHITGPDGRPAPDCEESLALEMGHRLRSRVRADDPVLALGEAEFGVVLQACGPEYTEGVRKRLLRDLGGSYRIGAVRLHLLPSVGGACYPADADTPARLIDCARQRRHGSWPDARGAWPDLRGIGTATTPRLGGR